MACHLVIGAGISKSGELELRAHVELSVQVGLMRFLRTVAGYLKSARVVAEEEMYAGWSLKRQRAWDAASMSERLRQVGINTENVHTEIPSDRVNICRLRAKWPQMEAFFWATLGKVEAEREEAKALHLLRFLRKAGI